MQVIIEPFYVVQSIIDCHFSHKDTYRIFAVFTLGILFQASGLFLGLEISLSIVPHPFTWFPNMEFLLPALCTRSWWSC